MWQVFEKTFPPPQIADSPNLIQGISTTDIPYDSDPCPNTGACPVPRCGQVSGVAPPTLLQRRNPSQVFYLDIRLFRLPPDSSEP